MKKLLLIALSGFLFISANAQTDTLQQIVPGRANSPEQVKKPYLIIISADGFRYDYVDKYHAKNLLKLAAGGVRAQSMIPSFPPVTTPNHFALMSGLYPSHSGIISNGFYDRQEKKVINPSVAIRNGEEPLWITAEKQKMLTASFYWISGNTPIHGVKTTYSFKTNRDKKVMVEDRIRALKNWLSMPEDKRPHFIAYYFPDADHAGHTYGPDAPQTQKAVEYIDNAVGRLAEVAKASGLPVNFIFVSDHGMTNIDQAHPLTTPEPVKNDKFIATNFRSLINVIAKDPADIMPAYEKLKAEKSADYDVYLKKDVPAELHFSDKDDKYNRIGDIIIMAKWPKMFAGSRVPAATHGFNPYKVKDMHATFIAWGPAFKPHLQIPSFKNVEVYDVMAQILGIKPLPNDGTGTLAKEILKQ